MGEEKRDKSIGTRVSAKERAILKRARGKMSEANFIMMLCLYYERLPEELQAKLAYEYLLNISKTLDNV